MLRNILFSLMSFFIAGCASQSYRNHQGLSGITEYVREDAVVVVTYSAFGFDSMETMKHFSEFRAVEVCKSQHNFRAHFLGYEQVKTIVGVAVRHTSYFICVPSQFRWFKEKLKINEKKDDLIFAHRRYENEGLVIKKVNGKDVTNYKDLFTGMDYQKGNNNFLLIENGKEVNRNLKLVDFSVRLAVQEQEILKNGCKYNDISKRKLCQK